MLSAGGESGGDNGGRRSQRGHLRHRGKNRRQASRTRQPWKGAFERYVSLIIHTFSIVIMINALSLSSGGEVEISSLTLKVGWLANDEQKLARPSVQRPFGRFGSLGWQPEFKLR